MTIYAIVVDCIMGNIPVKSSLICTSGSEKVYGRRTKPTTITHLEPFNVIITRLYVIGDVIKIDQAAR